jgi:hypothetical protein
MGEYFTPDTLLDDTLDELREAREMVAYLTRANEALAAECDRLRAGKSYPYRLRIETVNGWTTRFSRIEEPKP